jgi:hypothetical protein
MDGHMSATLEVRIYTPYRVLYPLKMIEKILETVLETLSQAVSFVTCDRQLFYLFFIFYRSFISLPFIICLTIVRQIINGNRDKQSILYSLFIYNLTTILDYRKHL